MRILVLSDSHGNVDAMVRCVEFAQPDAVLHLGDCLSDAEALHRELQGRVPSAQRIGVVKAYRGGKRIFLR